MNAHEGWPTAQDVVSNRKNRLLAELPPDNAACTKLMKMCAACLVMLLIGVVIFEPGAQARTPDPSASWSQSAGLAMH